MQNRNTSVRCAIIEKDVDEILVLVSFDYLNQSAEFYNRIISREEQSKGTVTFVVLEMLHHVFGYLNLQRIELMVLEHNCRARHLYEKAGFVQEGVNRIARHQNGKFINMVLYSILSSEFQWWIFFKYLIQRLYHYFLSLTVRECKKLSLHGERMGK